MSGRITLPLSFLLAALLVIAASVFSIPRAANSQATSAINGYAWSETIGWIDLNCANTNTCASSNFGLSVDSAGMVSGYAWSENIGWVKFGGLSSFPAAGGNAQIVGNTLIGWARACAGTAPGDCSTMVDRSDGWDGWIALKDPTGNTYGVTLSAGNFNICNSTTKSCAWGDVNTGWLSFENASTTFQACAATQGNVCLDGNTSQSTNAFCTVTTDTCTTNHGAGWFCSNTNGLCNPPPAPVSNLSGAAPITALPKIIKPGVPATVSWDVSNVTSCSVTGSNGDSWSGVSSSLATCTHSGSGCSSAPITKATTFTISCTGLGGNLSGSAAVSLTPKFQER